jgi:hypothetical protein
MPLCHRHRIIEGCGEVTRIALPQTATALGSAFSRNRGQSIGTMGEIGGYIGRVVIVRWPEPLSSLAPTRHIRNLRPAP